MLMEHEQAYSRRTQMIMHDNKNLDYLVVIFEEKLCISVILCI